MEPRLRAMGYTVEYVGRDASASPATGSRSVHLHEQHELVEAALSGPVPHIVRASPDGRPLPAEPSLPAREERVTSPTA
jgi:hypothetical protein